MSSSARRFPVTVMLGVGFVTGERRLLAGQQGLAVAVPVEAFLPQERGEDVVDAVGVLCGQSAEQERWNRFVVEVVAQSGQ